MGKTKKHSSSLLHAYSGRALCILIILLAVLMILPVSVALSAGIASLSIAIFGISLMVVITLFIKRPENERPFVIVAFVAALFGLIFPQTAFLMSAEREGVSLTFSPLSYVTFSGATTIEPTKIIPYKDVGSETLELAYYQTEIPGTTKKGNHSQ